MVFIQIIWTQEQVAGVSVSISSTADAMLKGSSEHLLDVVKSILHVGLDSLSVKLCDLLVLLPLTNFSSFCSFSFSTCECKHE